MPRSNRVVHPTIPSYAVGARCEFDRFPGFRMLHFHAYSARQHEVCLPGALVPYLRPASLRLPAPPCSHETPRHNPHPPPDWLTTALPRTHHLCTVASLPLLRFRESLAPCPFPAFTPSPPPRSPCLSRTLSRVTRTVIVARSY